MRYGSSIAQLTSVRRISCWLALWIAWGCQRAPDARAQHAETEKAAQQTTDKGASKPTAADNAGEQVQPAPPVPDVLAVIPASDSPLGKARTALRAQDWEELGRLVSAIDPTTLGPWELGLWQYFESRALSELKHPDADKRWRALIATTHPLAVPARYELAKRLQDSAPAEAETLLGALPSNWTLSRAADRLRAALHNKQGRRSQAIALLRKEKDLYARSELADLLATGNANEKAEAANLYAALAAESPTHSLGKAAATNLADLEKALRPKDRRALKESERERMMTYAEALYDAREFEDAVEAYRKAAAKFPRKERCKAWLGQGRALHRARKRPEAAGLLERAIPFCKGADLVSVYYLAGEARAKSGSQKKALAHYAALLKLDRNSSLNDDALYRSARQAEELGDKKEAARLFEKLCVDYPRGDMCPDALFRRAFVLRQDGDLQGSLALLRDAVERKIPENREGKHGRFQYWMGRTELDLGNQEAAIAAFDQLIEDHPLNYHAQLAMSRLQKLDPERAARHMKRWDGTTSRHTSQIPLPDAPKNVAYQRAVGWLAVGEDAFADAALRKSGALGSGASKDVLWLVAALYDRAGYFSQSITLSRLRLKSFRDTTPDTAYAFWRLAYPEAYDAEVRDAATQRGVPVELVRAIAREESSYNERAVSIARAYGMVQVIQPTARRWGGEIGLPSDPESLRTAKINLHIGARFMRYLQDKYSVVAFIPPAYNAGNHAVDRWLAEQGDLPLDVWIETIPYLETRRYTRRVLQSLGTYHALETGTLPDWLGEHGKPVNQVAQSK